MWLAPIVNPKATKRLNNESILDNLLNQSHVDVEFMIASDVCSEDRVYWEHEHEQHSFVFVTYIHSIIRKIKRDKKLRPNRTTEAIKVSYSNCQAGHVVPSGSLKTIKTNAIAMTEHIKLKIPSKTHHAIHRIDANRRDGV